MKTKTSICSPFTKEELPEKCSLQLFGQPVKLSENIAFLGEIPVVHDFEPIKPIGKSIRENRKVADYLYDDSALVYQSAEGLFIIIDCSYSGICNITAFPWQRKSKWEKNWSSGKEA